MELKTLWSLLLALPELLKLIQAVQKGIDETDTNRKVADDIKSIHEAFAAKDADKLNAIFNPSSGVLNTAGN